jgi:hypothetical protein
VFFHGKFDLNFYGNEEDNEIRCRVKIKSRKIESRGQSYERNFCLEKDKNAL